ncbi:heme ABC transporter ATP-binding protein [Nocardioides daejeonensis]|uniref:heme ABC transporter ATP-binding protein n=1 Tax=Nocardioides daejeonensis TaxID=1046556 RepID=UPI000D742BE1|nr:heme ABC transporter ATP-binding protein [Nocardioides daejeonensis]
MSTRSPRGDTARDAVLSGHGISLSLNGTTILNDVDIEVRAGEVLSLVGPNGAGKSTLLAVLAGDHAPERGEVRLYDQPLSAHSARALARERGMLLQKQNLAFGFRVHEVVEMGRAPWHRTDRAAYDETVVEASMKRADVTHLRDRHFPTLSGGEQARTAFARLLAQETSILMLDEPTAALDIHHQEQVLEVAREAADSGSAVVVVLHDLSLAAAHSDRVCVLAQGQVRATGTPREVLTPELLSDVYRHPVQVLEHEGHLVVVPQRRRRKEEL